MSESVSKVFVYIDDTDLLLPPFDPDIIIFTWSIILLPENVISKQSAKYYACLRMRVYCDEVFEWTKGKSRSFPVM